MDRINKLESLVDQYKQIMQGQVALQKHIFHVLTYHSMAIEGSTLTQNQVCNLLDLHIPAPNKSSAEQQVVIDYQKALIFTLNKAKEHAPLTETLIRQIEALVMENTGSVYNTDSGTFNSAHGDYRLLNVFPESRCFPDSTQVSALMETLVSEINDKIGQVQTFDQKCELAFELHYRFAGIYPFVDGNGRTGRLLMNYLLTLFDLPAFCAFKKNRISYILALENARMTDDRPDFYACMYKQYQLFLEKELKAIEG